MKVLHLCSANSMTGAGGAALMTHEMLLNVGVDSRILFLVENKSTAKGEYSYVNNKVFRRIQRKLTTFLDSFLLYFYRSRESRLFSPGLFGLKLHRHSLILWADIIHVHWVNHGFVDISEISKWDKKIVWTLRDMWAFTGGCHYTLDCEKYQKVCTSCVHLGSKKTHDLAYFSFSNKFKYLNKTNITWVAISSWMKDAANKSNILCGQDVQIVFSGIRTDDFYLGDKNIARLKLGIEVEKKVILIGATSLKEKYKGFDFIIDCLNAISSDIFVIVFGRDILYDHELKQDIMNVGFVESSDSLRVLYNAADVFLSPSIAEAFGKTFAEAQSCGLPVVCFDNTGPADIILHRKTGYIAEFGDLKDLICGVNYCLENNLDSRYIRERAVELFDIKSSVNKYLNIYKQKYEK
jgi:glycosyltransferase involved in cell wall biosynthesis